MRCTRRMGPLSIATRCWGAGPAVEKLRAMVEELEEMRQVYGGVVHLGQARGIWLV